MKCYSFKLFDTVFNFKDPSLMLILIINYALLKLCVVYLYAVILYRYLPTLAMLLVVFIITSQVLIDHWVVIIL